MRYYISIRALRAEAANAGAVTPACGGCATFDFLFLTIAKSYFVHEAHC
jgi:hypothetical protein